MLDTSGDVAQVCDHPGENESITTRSQVQRSPGGEFFLLCLDGIVDTIA